MSDAPSALTRWAWWNDLAQPRQAALDGAAQADRRKSSGRQKAVSRGASSLIL
jgi:hypothetical protein